MSAPLRTGVLRMLLRTVDSAPLPRACIVIAIAGEPDGCQIDVGEDLELGGARLGDAGFGEVPSLPNENGLWFYEWSWAEIEDPDAAVFGTVNSYATLANVRRATAADLEAFELLEATT